MYYFNGDIYDGDWFHDMRQGRGKYTYSSGAYYDGQWKDDKKEGKGFFDWGDGTTYRGDWSNNQRCGYGVNKYADGDVYKGQWMDDIQQGRGIYIFQNGDQYEETITRANALGKASSSMLMAISIPVISTRENALVKARLCGPMVTAMKACGKTIF